MRICLLVFTLLFLPFSADAVPLPAKDVFVLSAKVLDPNTFTLDWQIKPGYFLYKDRIKIDDPAQEHIQLGPIRLPVAHSKPDRSGKSYSIYRNTLSLPVAVLGIHAGETLLKVHYQGCSDSGFCYPPVVKEIKLSINNNLALEKVSIESSEPSKQQTNTTDKQDSIESVYQNSSWFMVIISFFGFGLLLAFTPCVLPMIPVLSGIIVGHGHYISMRKAFFLSLSYVLSMSFTYAIAGAIVALLGKNLQIIMQASWALAIFSFLFILLALSMFGFFELKLPVTWQAKIASLSRSQNGGHYLGAAIMGCLSTLILSPCVTAPLIGALSYIAQTGNVLFGTMTLFFLGLGMGTPLLLIGTSAGKILPKAGPWMSTVKNFFGILLLAVAIYLMSRLLPPSVTMMLWASLLVFSGIFMGALYPAQTSLDKMHQSAGILLLVYGLLILAGASMGSRDPLQPLAGMFSKAIAADNAEVIHVKTLAELNEALKKTAGQPVMLDFYADWCSSCKLMEKTTLQNKSVQHLLNQLAIIKVDVTDNSVDQQKIMAQYQVIAPPTFIFINSQGVELNQWRLVGDTETPDFLQHLHQVINSFKV